MAEFKIQFHVNKVDPELEVLADPELLSQVLINLLKNAMEALAKQNNPSISLIMRARGEKSIVIIVKDNGPGIPPDVLENVFIPFFTTKDRGSGIGLSISKQIIQQHKGVLTVRSEPGKGTTCTIMI